MTWGMPSSLQGLFSRVPAGAKAVKPRVYATIDRATSEYLSAPNLAQNADVISTINSAVDPAYASNKACKRICQRIRTRNQRVQYVALQLLENCVRSCGEPFHAELAHSDLLTELGRMADRSVWCATDIQRLVLALIQEWAYELRYPRFSEVFNRLKRLNLPFEPRGGPMEARLQPYPGYSPPPPHAAAAAAAHQNGRTGPQRPMSRPGSPPAGSAHLGPDLLRPDRSPTELLSDLQAARGTVALLTEVLDGIEADGSWDRVKDEYCCEVAGACGALSQRLAGLVSAGVSDERVIAVALELNDDVQRALDRRGTLVQIAEGQRPPPRVTAVSQPGPQTTAAAATSNGHGDGAPATTSETPILTTTTTTTSQQPGQTTSSGGAPARGGPQETTTTTQNSEPTPLIDLLSLDWEPTPVPEPFVAPPPIAAPQQNNPFAAAPPASAVGTTGTTASAQHAASAPNPFLHDDAFASVTSLPPPTNTQPQQAQTSSGAGGEEDAPASSSFPRPQTGAAVPAAPVGSAPASASSAPASEAPVPATGPAPTHRPPSSSGNPFAASAAPPSHVASSSGGLSFQRRAPPSVIIPPNDGDYPSAGPMTAPAGYMGGRLEPTTATMGGGPAPPPMTSTGSFPANRSSFDFDRRPSTTAGYPSIYTPTPGAIPPTSGAGAFGGPGKKGTDAFSELVSLTPKREEVPPPPK
jgi:hypothetical protein